MSSKTVEIAARIIKLLETAGFEAPAIGEDPELWYPKLETAFIQLIKERLPLGDYERFAAMLDNPMENHNHCTLSAIEAMKALIYERE